MKQLLIATLCISLTLHTGCRQEETERTIQEGDILFQDLNCGPLCDAIESVTRGFNGKKFSHCGLVVKIDDSLKVAEAIGDAVRISSINHFFARSSDTNKIRNIVAGRLKEQFRGLIASASAFATLQKGVPYDNEYLPDNGKWYCSELIDEAFRQANGNQPLFKKEPMTFKNPRTGSFDSAWINYFRKLGKAIPEGIPGINPGLMTRSDCLELFVPSGETKMQ